MKTNMFDEWGRVRPEYPLDRCPERRTIRGSVLCGQNDPRPVRPGLAESVLEALSAPEHRLRRLGGGVTPNAD
jgi:hypothetical protein